MTKRIAHIFILSAASFLGLCPFGSAYAADQPAFDQRHQAGIRFGTWINGGQIPPPAVIDTLGNEVRTDINDASPYLEIFGAYRLSPQFMLELSLGFVNRGDVSFSDGPREYFGNLILYPILVKFRYYFPSPGRKLIPYVQAGGGIYYGRHSVQFTNDIYFSFNEDSETDFTYALGGGIDWPVASSIGLELNAQYMPVNFSKDLIFVKDYQAITVTFGVKYLFASPEKGSGPRR